MIVEYQANLAETVTSTLEFLNRRPVVKIIMLLMKISCGMLSILYILKAIAAPFSLHDMLVLSFALIWLFWQRSINCLILKRILKRQNFNATINKFHISQHKLWWQNPIGKQTMQQEWKHIKYVYQTPSGYIVPSTGITNAGKFIWLPKRGFTATSAEQQFLQLLTQLNVTIK